MMQQKREYKYAPDEKGTKSPGNRGAAINFLSYTVLIGLEIILVGIILFLWAQDMLTGTEAVAYFLLGLGGLLFFDTMLRYIWRGPRIFTFSRIVISLVFLSGGGAVLGGIGTWWPLIIILAGAAVLLNALLTLIRGSKTG
jgi:hypothetical protein